MPDRAEAQQAGLDTCAVVNVLHANPDDRPLECAAARELLAAMSLDELTNMALFQAGWHHVTAHERAAMYGIGFEDYMGRLARIVVDVSNQIISTDDGEQ